MTIENNYGGHIYILLFPNGKRYIGQTIQDIEKRMKQHWDPPRRERKLPVHCAIKKYGKDNIKVEKVLDLKCTQEYLDLIEDRAIIAFNTLAPNGYNLRRGGSHGALSEETKAKIATARTGTHRSEETKSKMSAAKKGRPFCEEHRAKLSAAKKGKPGRPQSKETKAKLSVINKGKVFSEETRAKMSMAKKRKT